MRELRKIQVICLMLLCAMAASAQDYLSEPGVEQPDSLPLPEIELPDSLSLPAVNAISDTLASDTAVSKSEPLEAPVIYQSSDSMVWVMGGDASLFGKSEVQYQNITLDAERIRMRIDSSLVYADGVQDSLGTWSGTPVFRDGETPYESTHMSYNFKTKKGYINHVVTQQGEGYMTSVDAKKGPDGEYYVQNGIYTTCDDHDDPHFGIRITRAKVRPGKDVVFGPAYLEVLGVPLPLFLPFGFFPFTQSDYASGIIMPTYGDELDRGFYLKDGGYYFAISDKVDLKLLGEIFTKGSWGVSAESSYRKRYKFSGSLYASYLVTKTGDKGLSDYNVSRDFKVRWSHRQDPKANPNRNFSASVNFATSSYERSNLSSLYNPALTSQSTRTSSVSYSRNFPGIGLSLSASMNLSQSMRDSTISISLPSLSLSLGRVYPFKRKKSAGDGKWYEKISLTYSGTLANSITSKESELLHKSLVRDWKNAMRHSIPISATFQLFKNINITPSVNYTARWYTSKVMQSWDDTRQTVRKDTIYGFNHVYDFNFSVQANTKLYGLYQPGKLWKKMFGEKLIMVRHVFSPSVSYSLNPDFSDPMWGMYDSYTYTDTEGEVHTVVYSPYAGMMYGTAPQGKSGSVSLRVSNNLEMKVRSDKDTTGLGKKIPLIDELGASISYNTAAKVRPWSNLSTTTRIKITKSYTFSLNAVWATYAYEFDENGRVVTSDRTEYSFGRFGRFQGMSQNLSYTFNNGTFKSWGEKLDKLFHKRGEGDEDEETEETSGRGSNDSGGRSRSGQGSGGNGGETKVVLDADGYTEYNIPWSLSFSYGINMREDTRAPINPDRMRYPYGFTHSLNISGNMKLTNKWNINMSSGWDFIAHDFTTTTMNITRDLHCFSMSCSIVLKPYTSYNFCIQANSSMVKDLLKYKKRSSERESVAWF